MLVDQSVACLMVAVAVGINYNWYMYIAMVWSCLVSQAWSFVMSSVASKGPLLVGSWQDNLALPVWNVASGSG